MPSALPPEFDERPFSVAEARSRGVHPDRLRRRDLRADFHGVRVPTHLPHDLEARCRALATRMRAGQHFSHLTAAGLWGMRLPRAWEGAPLHVTSVLPGRTPRTRGVIGHHADPPGPDLVERRGFLIPSPVATWCSLATLLTIDDLVVAGDGLVQRHDPLCAPEQLVRAVAGNAGRRGNRSLRVAIGLIRAGTDSIPETRLRLDVGRAGLPEPEVNGILSRPGERARFGDLVFRRWRVVAEYEGVHHQESRAAYLADLERFDALGNRWRFVRLAKEHTTREAVARIRRALRDAGWPG